MVMDLNGLKGFCVFFVLQSPGAQRLFDHPVYYEVHRENFAFPFQLLQKMVVSFNVLYIK
jgi:hypothetical protein